MIFFKNLEENFRFRLLDRCGTNGGGDSYMWSVCYSHNRSCCMFDRFLSFEKNMFRFHVTSGTNGGVVVIVMCVCVVDITEVGVCLLTGSSKG